MAAEHMRDVAMRGIDAETLTLGDGVQLGERCRITARTVTVGDNVAIADDVRIACDELWIGADTRIDARVTIVSPKVRVGERSVIGSDVHAELNERFEVGRLCDLGRSMHLVAQGFRAGDHLWVTDNVIVGGGGARGPRSYLQIGDRSAIMDRCFINVSEPVSIGSDTALSNGVTVLTHSLWQPVLDGGTSQFAPVRIGSRCIVYVNAIIAPGVTIGDDVTIGGGALVLQDVPRASTALGNPARVMRSTPAVPRELSAERQDTILRDVLAGWAATLVVKGVAAEYREGEDRVVVAAETTGEVISYIARSGPAALDAATTISLAFGAAPPATSSRCHFDLAARTLTGTPTALAEDLRDYLRRRTIRIYTDRPFHTLPPANVARLRARLQQTT